MPLREGPLPHRNPPGPLRLRRLTLGLTQADVAARAGISRDQVVRLEAGLSSPTWRTAVALAAALDRSPLQLFPVSHESLATHDRVASATEVNAEPDVPADMDGLRDVSRPNEQAESDDEAPS